MEAAFVLLLVAIAVDTVMWVLGTFVIAPTGLDEMREVMGANGASRQAAMAVGFMVVTNALFLLVAFKMREGRRWARIAVVGVGALLLLSLLDSTSMNGLRPGSVAGALYNLFGGVSPNLPAAGAVLLMFLPAANRYFSSTPRNG
ncbi:hypothetical protein [Streptomyces sp. NPDC058280]|uniref:hypothetical protein n=1 Tax=Streptomyces sp. NPDC058280 TaxID=3346419 RepID=UPI0036E0D1C2